MSPRHSVFSALSLIEASIEPTANSSFCAKNVEILDTFATQRADRNTAKSLSLLGSIIENSLPLGADASQTFDLVLSLFQDALLFTDWKVPPFILGMSFFVHEGIDLAQFSKTARISQNARKAIESLPSASLNDLYHMVIEHDLLLAILESIGVAEKYYPSV